MSDTLFFFVGYAVLASVFATGLLVRHASPDGGIDDVLTALVLGLAWPLVLLRAWFGAQPGPHQ